MADGNSDLDGLAKAINAAKAVSDKPSIIKVKTTIGFGSVNEGQEKVHGAPLGADDIRKVLRNYFLVTEIGESYCC